MRDFGVTALFMVLIRYETWVSLARVSELAKMNAEGTTAREFIEAAKTLSSEIKDIGEYLSLFDVPNISFLFHTIELSDRRS